MRVRGTALALSGLVLVIGVALAAAGLRPAGAAGTATVQITPPSSYVQTGSTVDVSIDVQNLSVGLGVYEFRIAYDPAKVEVVAVANTGFLGSTGRLVNCGDQSEPGVVDYRCNTSTLQPAGPKGNGTLAQIRFKGLAEGEAALHFEKLDLGVEEGDGIDITNYGEAVIQVGTGAPQDPDGGDDGSDGDGTSNEATPTKVPRALTPTIPAGALLTPTPAAGASEFETYDPRQAGQAPRQSPSGVINDSGGGPTGAVRGAASGAPGSNFPVAGAGPQASDERFSASALRALVLAGGLLMFLGVVIARRKQEA